MKRNFLIFVVSFAIFLPTVTWATPVLWDKTGSILQPLLSSRTDEVKVNFLTATSTTATSTFANAVQIGSTAGSNLLKITAGRAFSGSESIGGMVNLNMGTNLGPAMTIYSNAGAGSSRLLSVVSDDPAYDTQALHVRSDSLTETTLNVLGSPQGKGIIKAAANGVADADGSVLSLDASVSGFLGQTTFFKCGTSIICSQWRTSANGQFLTIQGDGAVGLGTTSPFATLSIVGIATTTRPIVQFASTSGAVYYNLSRTGSTTIGGGATTTGVTINGGATTSGSIIGLGGYHRFGPCQPDYITGGPQFHFCGDNNSNAGVQSFVENKNAGVSGYSGYTLLNNTSVDNATNFAGIYLNSSGYNDATFGSGFNVANQFQVQNAVGPLTIAASTSTAPSAFINFITNGTASSNERMRIDANGNVGIGTTSPYSMLSVAGTTTAMQFEATSTNSTSTLNGGLAVGKALRLIGLPSCDSLDTDGNGFVVCGSDATGAGGTGSNWQFYNATAIRPTTTVGITVSASSTFTADLTAGSTTLNSLKVSTTSTSSITGPLQMGTTTGDNLMTVNCATRAWPASNSVGGCLSLRNGTVNLGAALMAYTNVGAGGLAPLIQTRVDDPAFPFPGIRMDYDGTNDALTLVASSGASNAASLSSPGLDHTLTVSYAGTTTDKGAGNFTSTNSAGSALQIVGNAAGLGVVKATHNGVGDANASLLSLSASDSGYLGQGQFMDIAMANTYQKLVNFRANSSEVFTLRGNGMLGLGTTSPYATLSVTGIASSTAPAFVVASSTGALYASMGGATTTLFQDVKIDAAGQFILPVAANPTVTIAGEVAVDTSSSSVRVASSTGSSFDLYAEQFRTFTYATNTTPTGSTTISLAGTPRAITYRQMGCLTNNGGSAMIQIGDGTASSTGQSTSNGLSTTFTALTSNNQFGQGEAQFIQIGNPTGSWTQVTCTFGYYNK